MLLISSTCHNEKKHNFLLKQYVSGTFFSFNKMFKKVIKNKLRNSGAQKPPEKRGGTESPNE